MFHILQLIDTDTPLLTTLKTKNNKPQKSP